MATVITKKACKRCLHSWFPRSTQRPAICPKCNSARWDEAPTKKQKSDAA